MFIAQSWCQDSRHVPTSSRERGYVACKGKFWPQDSAIQPQDETPELATSSFDSLSTFDTIRSLLITMSTSIFYSNKRVVVGAITALAFLLFLILVGIDRSDEVTAHTTTYFQRLKNMTSTNSQPSSEQWATMKAYLSEIESAVKGLRTPALSAATVPTGSMEDIMNRTLGVGLPFASILERSVTYQCLVRGNSSKRYSQSLCHRGATDGTTLPSKPHFQT